MNGLIGILCMLATAWLFSAHRTKVSVKLVAVALASQALLGFLLLSLGWSDAIFTGVDTVFSVVLDGVLRGAFFVFGSLAVPAGTEYNGASSLGFLFAFQALPTVIVFSSILALLYHVGLMQRLISLGARFFHSTLRISGVESVLASANIVVGIETVFAIQPYLQRMTKSELSVMLTLGMATVASSVLGLYILILKPVFPDIAGHLVTASIMSAPAAVMFSKILIPETEQAETAGQHVKPVDSEYDNWFAAVIGGSRQGVTLCVGLAALLIAVLAITGIGDSVVGATSGALASAFGWEGSLTLQTISAAIMYPFAWMTGIESTQVSALSQLLGDRLLLTEAVAYQHLSTGIDNGTISGQHNIVVCTYALCGFAHIASVAIFVGGASALAPSRANDLSRIAPRALLAATLACLSTAAIAGLYL